MYSGIYEIAGLTVEIRSLHPEVQRDCAGYESSGAPLVTVEICQKDINFEREKSAGEDRAEGIPLRNFPDGYLETLAVYRKLAEYMLQKRQTLLFHGSAIAVDGKAYLFTAASGTGKSTHTRLWRELLGERAVMVNDDKPLLHITPEGVTVYGTPWNGKHRLGTNMAAPLAALCVLERGQTNVIREVSPREVLPMLIQQSYHPQCREAYPAYLSLLNTLTEQLRFYRLHCNMEPEAARVSFEGMAL